MVAGLPHIDAGPDMTFHSDAVADSDLTLDFDADPPLHQSDGRSCNCWPTDPPILHCETSLLICKPLRLQDEPQWLQDEPPWLRTVSLHGPRLLIWMQKIQIHVPKLMQIYADLEQQHCSRNDLYDLHIIAQQGIHQSLKLFMVRSRV
jgi:hypothetical protein